MNRDEQKSREPKRKTTPEKVKARARFRHEHVQNAEPNSHHREKSYRAHAEEEQLRLREEELEWANAPGGELSLEQQYRTDGEEHNYRGPLAENPYSEYPRYGHNLDRRRLVERKRLARKDFSGVGPRGYKRADARIEEEVCEILARDEFIDASDISVDVDEGIVRLAGTVENREDRVEAEMLAETVLGVIDIENDISVRKNRMRESWH